MGNFLTIVKLEDNGYIYQLTDLDDYIDEVNTKAVKMDLENYYHWYAANFAKNKGYGYRRIKNEREKS